MLRSVLLEDHPGCGNGCWGRKRRWKDPIDLGQESEAVRGVAVEIQGC